MDVLAGFDRLVEVGVGRRPNLAVSLVERGVSVVATDVVARSVPDGVEFVVDDVTDPDPDVYVDADAVYARNLPPELQRPALEAAGIAGAPLYFTTLGGDPSVVEAERRSLSTGTVFVA